MTIRLSHWKVIEKSLAEVLNAGRDGRGLPWQRQGGRGETIQPCADFAGCFVPCAVTMMSREGRWAMSVTNGLYSIHIEMKEGGRGHATGIIVLLDGKIAGGDSHFYYTGSYTADHGKWRGELVTNQHARSAGQLPLFGGREVTCGFTGSYSADTGQVDGMALVGKTSVMWHAELLLRAAL